MVGRFGEVYTRSVHRRGKRKVVGPAVTGKPMKASNNHIHLSNESRFILKQDAIVWKTIGNVCEKLLISISSLTSDFFF